MCFSKFKWFEQDSKNVASVLAPNGGHALRDSSNGSVGFRFKSISGFFGDRIDENLFQIVIAGITANHLFQIKDTIIKEAIFKKAGGGNSDAIAIIADGAREGRDDAEGSFVSLHPVVSRGGRLPGRHRIKVIIMLTDRRVKRDTSKNKSEVIQKGESRTINGDKKPKQISASPQKQFVSAFYLHL